MLLPRNNLFYVRPLPIVQIRQVCLPTKKRTWAVVHQLAIGFVALILLAAAWPAQTKTASVSPRKTAAAEKVSWDPTRIVNGAPVLLGVHSAEKLRSLRARWLDHDFPFVYDGTSDTWSALAGVSVKTKPGIYTIEITAERAHGESVTFNREIPVKAAQYRTVALSVPRKFTEPSPGELEAIKKDEVVKKDVFDKITPSRQWVGKFHSPVSVSDVRISDQFGTERKFNGKVQSVHQGLDYAVPQGTPVLATNAGTVVLAQPLFFEGGCVMIDHGQGLLTLYMHLSEINIKLGDHVERGQQLGLSGASGRATGAHLHVAVRWQGTYLDPATLFGLPLPVE
jgi:murein DD-endopeptidase MepM/ murein hydrolase activator NlpD